jgi:hypothetical protein
MALTIISSALAAVPVQAVLPAAEAAAANVANFARPLVGVGAATAVALVFQPLLRGFLRAAILLVSPRQSTYERQEIARRKDEQALQMMAREFDLYQPSQAAELRYLAGRD